MNNRVRKVDAAGIINTIAGYGITGPVTTNFNGFYGLSDTTELNRPVGVAVNDHGVIYVCDNLNELIRKLKDTTFSIHSIQGMPSHLCTGSSVTLSDSTSGGSWSSSNTSVASIGSSSGLLTSVAPGIDTISYYSYGCLATATIKVPGYEIPQICVVVNDSATGKNEVVWEKTGIETAEWYNIYRENSSSVFVKIDSQASNIFSTYIDTGSYPVIQSYSYKITLTDSCGNESPLDSSTTHTTIHLTASLGVGGVVNLNWNLYVGKPITTQNIMRSAGGGAFVSIGSVANTVISYTDATPPSGSLIYMIATLSTTGCNPTARITSGSEYEKITSNPVDISSTAGLTNLADPFAVQIRPNPTTDNINISSTAVIYNIVITNTIGQKVFASDYSDKNVNISLELLPPGVYLVKINNSSVYKVVKQ